MDRHHDQPGGGDHHGQVRRHVPVRGVHPVEGGSRRGAERATDDQHGHHREGEHEDQRQRFAHHQLQLGPHQAANGACSSAWLLSVRLSSRSAGPTVVWLVALQEVDQGVLEAGHPHRQVRGAPGPALHQRGADMGDGRPVTA